MPLIPLLAASFHFERASGVLQSLDVVFALSIIFWLVVYFLVELISSNAKLVKDLQIAEHIRVLFLTFFSITVMGFWL